MTAFRWLLIPLIVAGCESQRERDDRANQMADRSIEHLGETRTILPLFEQACLGAIELSGCGTSFRYCKVPMEPGIIRRVFYTVGSDYVNKENAAAEAATDACTDQRLRSISVAYRGMPDQGSVMASSPKRWPPECERALADLQPFIAALFPDREDQARILRTMRRRGIQYGAAGGMKLAFSWYPHENYTLCKAEVGAWGDGVLNNP